MVGTKGTIMLLGDIYLRTGTRIGTSEEEFEIGGLDNPVIKDPVTARPYIPGSSLKGRGRALFELLWMDERNVDPDVFFGGHHNERHECGFVSKEVYRKAKKYLRKDPPWLDGETCPVCRLFGSAGDGIGFANADENVKRLYDEYRELEKELENIVNVKKEARVAFRDAHPTRYTLATVFERMEGEYTEIKHENAINRVSGEANPRTMERIPKGSRFGLEIVYRVEDEDELERDLAHLLTALKLIEDQGIGHSTTRGYGRVEFRIAAVCARSAGWYLNPEANGTVTFPSDEHLERFDEDEVSHVYDLREERYETVITVPDLEEGSQYLRPEELRSMLDEVVERLPWG